MAGDEEPKAIAKRPTASLHFRIDLNAMSYGELFWLSPWGFAVMAGRKLLRIRQVTPGLGPLSENLGVMAWEGLPERARDKLRPKIEELVAEGFTPEIIYSEDWRELDVFFVACVDAERTTLAVTNYTGVWSVEGRLLESVDLTLRTCPEHARAIETTCSRYRVVRPPEVDAVFVRPQPVSKLLRRHRERIADLLVRQQPYRSAEPLERFDSDDLEARLLACSRREAQFNIDRGVYVPATREELARMDCGTPARRRRAQRALGLVFWIALALIILLLGL